jgi:hypothetical protein
MSFLSWLSPKKKPARAASTGPASSGLSRMESTKPFSASRQASAEANAKPANRKNERMARRELLYNVVREAMVRAGVLSSSYKFKVLSLDPRGRQFLVMVDLAQGAGAETVRLAEIEAAIAQQAKARYDILVSAVYWRSADHVAVGDPTQRPVSISRPAPLEPHRDLAPAVQEHVSQPAELTPAPVERPQSNGRYEPLHPEEVAAFKRALSAGSTAAAAHAAAQAAVPASARTFDGSAKHGPQSYTLLTGFEDTEMPDAPPAAALSATQYGDLR